MVNAGGMFAAEIGRLAGVRVPVIPMSHQYLVTQPFRERDPDNPLPTLRDPDLLVYYREEGGGLVMGGYERDSQPAFMPDGPGSPERIPPDFNGRLLEDDWDRFEEITENSKRRVPVMDEVTITRLINGPEAFTPDNEFCLGESEVAGFFVAAGFCAHGLAGAGGIGKVMAEWIAGGEPEIDLWHMDIRRFGHQYRSPSLHHRADVETYESYYDIRYPNHERQAGRPLRVCCGERVAPRSRRGVRREVGLGAGQLVRGERAGGRRVHAPARLGGPALVAGDRRRAPRDARDRRDLRRVLVREARDRRARRRAPSSSASATTRSPADAGKITYTQMLNSRGGIECDFTVARLDEELFSIVTGTAFGNHDREWIRRQLQGGAGANQDLRGAVSVRDVTSAWACFGIWGPKAREILQPLTPQDLGNESFPYMSVREMTVGDVPVRALRVTYVGELGWELYCPTEYGIGLWRALWEAGEPHGMHAGGYRAIDSMRLEKGYRVWGADITPDETPYEGGVGFCVKLDKDGGFIGRDALAEAKERGPRTKLCCITLADPRSVALGNEPVRVGGEIAGRVTTGGYGYTVGSSIAYAYVPPGARRARYRGRGRDLRGVDRGGGRAGAALRPRGRAGSRLGRSWARVGPVPDPRNHVWLKADVNAAPDAVFTYLTEQLRRALAGQARARERRVGSLRAARPRLRPGHQDARDDAARGDRDPRAPAPDRVQGHQRGRGADVQPSRPDRARPRRRQRHPDQLHGRLRLPPGGTRPADRRRPEDAVEDERQAQAAHGVFVDISSGAARASPCAASGRASDGS